MRNLDKKEETYEKYSDLLCLIYHVGRGVMFATQIYLLVGYHHKNQMCRDLSNLLEVNFVDKLLFDRRTLIKLKASALKRILGKDKVQSIEVTKARIFLSAYISQIVYDEYLKKGQKKMELSELLNKIRQMTTLWYQYEPYNLADTLYYHFNKMNMDMSGLVLLNEPACVYYDKTSETYKKNHMLKLMDRNVYIYRIGIHEGTGIKYLVIRLAYLDINHNLSVNSIVNTIIKDSFDYYNDVFRNEYNVKGKVVVRYIYDFFAMDAERNNYINNHVVKYLKSGARQVDVLRTEYNTYNLDITNRYFNGDKIVG